MLTGGYYSDRGYTKLMVVLRRNGAYYLSFYVDISGITGDLGPWIPERCRLESGFYCFDNVRSRYILRGKGTSSRFLQISYAFYRSKQTTKDAIPTAIITVFGAKQQ